MFERFTDRARKCLTLSCLEAQSLGHPAMTTGHLLAGIMREDAGVGANVLKNLDVSHTRVRSHLNALSVERHDDTSACQSSCSPGQYPRACRVNTVLDMARASAQALRHNYVGTEHLLLALVQTPSSSAQVLFRLLNVSSAQIMRETCLILGQPMPDTPFAGTFEHRSPDEAQWKLIASLMVPLGFLVERLSDETEAFPELSPAILRLTEAVRGFDRVAERLNAGGVGDEAVVGDEDKATVPSSGMMDLDVTPGQSSPTFMELVNGYASESQADMAGSQLSCDTPAPADTLASQLRTAHQDELRDVDVPRCYPTAPAPGPFGSSGVGMSQSPPPLTQAERKSAGSSYRQPGDSKRLPRELEIAWQRANAAASLDRANTLAASSDEARKSAFVRHLADQLPVLVAEAASTEYGQSMLAGLTGLSGLTSADLMRFAGTLKCLAMFPTEENPDLKRKG